LDYGLLDLLLYAYEQDVSVENVSRYLGLEEKQIRRAFRDFASKENATWHLRQMPPALD
jgi:hypothetical protein